MGRRAVLLAVALVVLAPGLWPEPSDGFPLSSYPMFSHDRGRVVALATAIGLDADGRVHRLGPQAIGGGDEPMLAAAAASRAARGDPVEARRFCVEVAARVADPAVESVEVRTEVRDAVADVTADDEPLDVVVHARCGVGP